MEEEAKLRNGSMSEGAKRVVIEEMLMTGRGGRRPSPEEYPFGELSPSRSENGSIVGPSFFIPERDDPKRLIAAGRKRHKHLGKVFLTRQMNGTGPAGETISGVRVWLAPEHYGK